MAYNLFPESTEEPVILDSPPPGELLVAELHRLGVHFLRTAPLLAAPAPLPPANLLASLAASPEARLRLAIIPLLLWRPEYAEVALSAARCLPSHPRLTLQCYYTAAVLLQRQHARRLQTLGASSLPLPDLFSHQLGLPLVASPKQRLAALAARQSQLSNESLNWLGTYQHAAETFLRHLELQAAWKT